MNNYELELVSLFSDHVWFVAAILIYFLCLGLLIILMGPSFRDARRQQDQIDQMKARASKPKDLNHDEDD